MYTFRQGIHVREPDPVYALHMRYDTSDIVATSPSFEALLEIRKQLARLGFIFVSLQTREAHEDEAAT